MPNTDYRLPVAIRPRLHRASNLRTAREIGECVLDLLVFVLVAALALSMRECEPDDLRPSMEQRP